MKNIYAGYIRKSSESKEKQALSIKSQREELQRTFPELNITEWIEEEKSAFTPFPQEPFQVISQEKFIFSSYRLHAMTANDVPHMAFLAFGFIKLSCRIAVIRKLFQ